MEAAGKETSAVTESVEHKVALEVDGLQWTTQRNVPRRSGLAAGNWSRSRLTQRTRDAAWQRADPQGRGRNECGSVVVSGGDPGLGNGRGGLFTNAPAIEVSKKNDVVMVDKTGTLTLGAPEVTDLVVDRMPEIDPLALVAAVEGESEHLLAQAVVRHALPADAPRWQVEGFSSIPTKGGFATGDGNRVAVGTTSLMDDESVGLGARGATRRGLGVGVRTAVLASVGGRAIAVIGVADAVRPTVAAAVAERSGLAVEVELLTGDHIAIAQRFGAQVDISTVIADVLPGDKAGKVKELMAAGRRVAMVSDGVKDAPTLPHADLRIAIGAGIDAAVRTADVVLTRSDPLDVAVGLRIGLVAVRAERQNVGWAIGYNTIALLFAAGVFEPAPGLVLRPGIAAITMAGSGALAAANALTLTWFRLPRSTGADPAGAPSGESSGASAGVSAVTGQR